MSAMKDNKLDPNTLESVTGGQGGWDRNPWGDGIGWSGPGEKPNGLSDSGKRRRPFDSRDDNRPIVTG